MNLIEIDSGNLDGGSCLSTTKNINFFLFYVKRYKNMRFLNGTKKNMNRRQHQQQQYIACIKCVSKDDKQQNDLVRWTSVKHTKVYLLALTIDSF